MPYCTEHYIEQHGTSRLLTEGKATLGLRNVGAASVTVANPINWGMYRREQGRYGDSLRSSSGRSYENRSLLTCQTGLHDRIVRQEFMELGNKLSISWWKTKDDMPWAHSGRGTVSHLFPRRSMADIYNTVVSSATGLVASDRWLIPSAIPNLGYVSATVCITDTDKTGHARGLAAFLDELHLEAVFFELREMCQHFQLGISDRVVWTQR
ncbi:hypothetical protein JB92DRAFT_2860171 [Gautieria morchelliformis]|nr:hypothetical protein JB92DRAFT_2860171 [Gautieria morchelliformis]